MGLHVGGNTNGLQRYVSLVKTRQDVIAIHAAKNNVLRLNAEYWKHVRRGDKTEAQDIRIKMARIKEEIRAKYDIIL